MYEMGTSYAVWQDEQDIAVSRKFKQNCERRWGKNCQKYRSDEEKKWCSERTGEGGKIEKLAQDFEGKNLLTIDFCKGLER